MPIVPRANAQQITEVTGLPTVRDTTRVEAAPSLGDALAPSIAAAHRIGQDIHEREDEAAVMAAAAKVSEAEFNAFDPSNETGTAGYKGLRAKDGVDPILAQRDKVAGEQREGLSKRQQAAFDRVMLQQRDQFHGKLATWRNQEYEVGMKAKEAAIVDTFATTGINAGVAGDTAASEENLGKALSATYLQTYRETGSEEAARAAEDKVRSAFHYNVALGIAKRGGGGVQQAKDYIDKHDDAITDPQQRQALDDMIEPTLQEWQDEDDALRYVDGGAPSGETIDEATGTVTFSNEPKDVQAAFRSIASRNNTITTSTVRPVIAKGAGERSQHPRGTAADFRTRTLTPEQGDALIADLKAHGFEVVDERNTAEPHIHAELPPGGRGGRGGAGGRGVAAKANSEADAIAAMKQNEPRERWKGLTAQIKRIYADRDRAEAEAKSDALEGMRLAIEDNGANVRSWREAVGPEAARMATQYGWDGILDAAQREKRGELVVKSDPVVVEGYERMMLYTPDTFASKKTKLKILSDMTGLSAADRANLIDKWNTINDPSKAPGAKLDWATEAERVSAGLVRLGLGDTKTDKNKTQAHQFRLAYRQAKEAFVKTYGKEPIGAEADKLLQNVTRNFAESQAKEKTQKYQTLDSRPSLSRVAAGDIEQARTMLAAAGKPSDDASVLSYLERYYDTHAD